MDQLRSTSVVRRSERGSEVDSVLLIVDGHFVKRIRYARVVAVNLGQLAEPGLVRRESVSIVLARTSSLRHLRRPSSKPKPYQEGFIREKTAGPVRINPKKCLSGG
ncbi:unnamed protein product [Haemonchus placei]|uniref:NtA domain-containing protein n=1 Tax=Haemonchus placei TaxID=6290 RepID=A0A0N4X608_HAEPC|nr:unnamed protein product [Haemonchus placei]